MKGKTAIVYDWIDKWGGVERLLLVLHDMFPDADFYTSYYDPAKASWAKDLAITSSFMQKLPDFIKASRILSLSFYPYAFESFNFSDYQVVISVSSSFAKGVITKPQTLHIAYLLTPTRYLWTHEAEYASETTRSVGKFFINHLKEWDRIAATRPDQIVSISQTVADRCRNYYDRSSTVIYPPFDTSYWGAFKKVSPLEEDYYLLVSRLEPYKKVDQVLEAFTTLPEQKLIVIGEGSQFKALRAKASHNVEFLSQVTDQKLAQYYTHARALIMPQEEDFGYVALEAQFFGSPVIAYRKGGAVETIIEEKTGIFYDDQTAESLKNTIQKFDIISNKFREGLKRRAAPYLAQFGRKRFETEFKDFIQSKLI